MRSAWLLMLVGGSLGLAACSTTPSAPAAAGAADHFYWRPARGQEAGALVVLLPGASGLKVFEDEGHYFRVAERLNAEGFDALVIDYKAAYHASVEPPGGDAGEKIAWVTERGVEWVREQGWAGREEPVSIVAWSLGAEGVWQFMREPSRASSMGLVAAAVYYPTNERGTPLDRAFPLLILTGDLDDVTPVDGVRKLASGGEGPPALLHVYEGARHGFDIETLPEKRTVRLVPLIGPSGTFGFSAPAAAAAAEALEDFLRSHAVANDPR